MPEEIAHIPAEWLKAEDCTASIDDCARPTPIPIEADDEDVGPSDPASVIDDRVASDTYE
jgi:hypothetical protein